MRERAKGGENKTPEHACPLVVVCRQSCEGAGNAAAAATIPGFLLIAPPLPPGGRLSSLHAFKFQRGK